MTAPMARPIATPLRFQIGARTLLSLPLGLVRLAWSLDDAVEERARALPPRGRADGYLLTSLPEALLGVIETAGHLARVRQRYARYWVDLTLGRAAWHAGLSANTRQSLRRKAKRLETGAAVDIRSYRTPDEIAAFHALARPLSEKTYQERLLDVGLPEAADLLTLAAARDAIRAWLLFQDGQPIAYLCCGGDGDTLRYDHVGHDPAFGHLSPGSVLQAEALRQLFDDRFARFDFTEGEGQHKRQLATGAVACVDLLLLRPTLANRAMLAALALFDRAVALAKRRVTDGPLRRLVDRIRRA